jgi:sRNA-binding carbon storage regulator CsrA
MLRIELKPGESVSIGNIAVVTLEEKFGQIARLAIQADRSVPISRSEKQSVAQIAAKRGLTGKD